MVQLPFTGELNSRKPKRKSLSQFKLIYILFNINFFLNLITVEHDGTTLARSGPFRSSIDSRTANRVRNRKSLNHLLID